MPKNNFYLLLILSQMALDDISIATIAFFRAIYPTLQEVPYLTATEMGELAGMSGVGAAYHGEILKKRGYMERRGYRAWNLSDRLIREPDLIKLMRLANGIT